MKRKALIIVGSLIGLFLIAVVVLPMVIDAERFRPLVQSQAKAALGREVTLGKLELSILSGGVVINDVNIADDPAFSRGQFLQAKSLKVGVELWPMLMSQEVHVNSVVLE